MTREDDVTRLLITWQRLLHAGKVPTEAYEWLVWRLLLYLTEPRGRAPRRERRCMAR
jgi:hypothetical protein